MSHDFIYTANPARIVFGPGSLAKVTDEIRQLGGSRALVLSTPFQREDAERLNHELGELGAGVFSEAAMHTPVAVTVQAVAAYAEVGADCVVALGGGSTIGLGKAIAYRNGAPQVVVATTYAGSEATPILGQTEEGVKTTVKDASILPEVVIYDANLTLGLPVGMSVTSGLNAMAHAVEGLYAKDRNPITALIALEGIRGLKEALPVIVERPGDVEARSNALYGSWLCGTVLGTVGMALHHKLCHTLGGSFDLPHAETHAIMLPHTVAYNARAAADVLAPAPELFGGELGTGLHDFARSLGAPLALKELGLAESDLDRAADLAVKTPYWNPQPVERDAVRELLQRAWSGANPE
ncbi:MAG: maleylacetate reductase [Alcanivoracaceae bacterium]|uniref:maleylacetate reductase n=1 Tax=unclassified Halomonas TaxID=2609666 RepID=UPI0004E35668|nr:MULTISPECIES: maleylacetate reductase [unclassified Halomonas]AJY48901.1 Maleylacetate reductase [Halomonas sp. KO116]MAX54608.1 maleylacetate reductase [Alcanivoracaceae bacterium]MCO7244197.1 maleylacetate reductase [Halomonas sp. Ps84H-12]